MKKELLFAEQVPGTKIVEINWTQAEYEKVSSFAKSKGLKISQVVQLTVDEIVNEQERKQAKKNKTPHDHVGARAGKKTRQAARIHDRENANPRDHRAK